MLATGGGGILLRNNKLIRHIRTTTHPCYKRTPQVQLATVLNSPGPSIWCTVLRYGLPSSETPRNLLFTNVYNYLT